MILHKQLKPLEERAGVIEKEIREAMAKGLTKMTLHISNHLSVTCSSIPVVLTYSTLYILTGDTNKEELLTVEYFKLLNEKNVLIKKQIELNLL